MHPVMLLLLSIYPTLLGLLLRGEVVMIMSTLKEHTVQFFEFVNMEKKSGTYHNEKQSLDRHLNLEKRAPSFLARFIPNVMDHDTNSQYPLDDPCPKGDSSECDNAEKEKVNLPITIKKGVESYAQHPK